MGIESDKRPTKIDAPRPAKGIEISESAGSLFGSLALPTASKGNAPSAEAQERAKQQQSMTDLWNSSSSKDQTTTAAPTPAKDPIEDRAAQQKRMRDLWG